MRSAIRQTSAYRAQNAMVEDRRSLTPKRAWGAYEVNYLNIYIHILRFIYEVYNLPEDESIPDRCGCGIVPVLANFKITTNTTAPKSYGETVCETALRAMNLEL